MLQLLADLLSTRVADYALLFFGARLLFAVLQYPRMLVPRYGRIHRILGMILFAYLAVGFVDARRSEPLFPRNSLWLYDALLSCLGFAVAYSAAYEFACEAVSRTRRVASSTRRQPSLGAR